MPDTRSCLMPNAQNIIRCNEEGEWINQQAISHITVLICSTFTQRSAVFTLGNRLQVCHHCETLLTVTQNIYW